jgi:hypothetical protein
MLFTKCHKLINVENEKFLNRGNNLARFGFTFKRSGVHTARTMMIEELAALISFVNRSDAVKADYRYAIEEENCLGKRSVKTRKLTYRHLVDLYSLDPAVTIFRALLFFWNRDVSGRPLLALLCAFSRDSVLRSTAPFILSVSEGTTIARESVEEYIDNQEPGRFSKATLQSTARNISSTWTKSGHLSGRSRKIRSRAKPTAGTVSFALLLGYLKWLRGEELFNSEYVRLLDCSCNHAVEFAEEASRRGWIVFKRIDNVIEALFPSLLSIEDMELIREQNQTAG